jgi:hypothetical protein
MSTAAAHQLELWCLTCAHTETITSLLSIEAAIDHYKIDHADVDVDALPDDEFITAFTRRRDAVLAQARRAPTELDEAARSVLVAWGDWAATVAYDHHNPKRVAMRRAMERLAAALPKEARS